MSAVGAARWRVTSRLFVGARVRGSAALRRQRYLVAGEPVFSLPIATFELAVEAAITL